MWDKTFKASWKKSKKLDNYEMSLFINKFYSFQEKGFTKCKLLSQTLLKQEKNHKKLKIMDLVSIIRKNMTTEWLLNVPCSYVGV